MTKLGFFGGAAFFTLVGFVACAGDDKAKNVQEAGAAGTPAAGEGPGPDAGGGGNEPTAGQGGAPPVSEAGAGGEPPLMSSGGAGGAEGGAGGAEGGAAPVYDCPAQPGSFTHSCTDVTGSWTPEFDFQTSTFHFDVSELPFPIKSGNASYFYYAGDAQYCGTGPVVVVGSDVRVTIPNPAANIYEAKIVDFNLIDVCEQHRDYDPIGVSCWELSANQSGNQLECVETGGLCPDVCE